MVGYVQVVNWEFNQVLQLTPLVADPFKPFQLDCEDRRRSENLKALLVSLMIFAL